MFFFEELLILLDESAVGVDLLALGGFRGLQPFDAALVGHYRISSHDDDIRGLPRFGRHGGCGRDRGHDHE